MPQHWHWKKQDYQVRHDVRDGRPYEVSLPTEAVTGDASIPAFSNRSTGEQIDESKGNAPGKDNGPHGPESDSVRSNSPEHTSVKHQHGQFEKSKANVIEDVHNEEDEPQLRMWCVDMDHMLTQADIDPVYGQGADGPDERL